jgi:hypothetical protein
MRTFFLLAGFYLCLPSAGSAQLPDYVPSQRLPKGRELVAVYIGSTDCGPCNLPQVKHAIRAMKPLLANQAKQLGMAFTAIGSTQDWDLRQGAAFFDSLGAFDQLVIGSNWTNLAVEHFILRDSLAIMGMPQVVVVERTVQLGSRVSISEPRLVRRIVGGTDIPAWVAAGAPVTVAADKSRQ